MKVLIVLPLAFAKLAHQQGAETFALVSAIGAAAGSSFFYPRTKGEVERDIQLVGFKSLTILRPSIIGGTREDSRLAEGVALGLAAYSPRFFRRSSTSILQRRSPECSWKASLTRSRGAITGMPKAWFDAPEKDIAEQPIETKGRLSL